MKRGRRGSKCRPVPLTPHSVKDPVGKGGTVLGTSRTNPFKKEQGVEKVL